MRGLLGCLAELGGWAEKRQRNEEKGGGRRRRKEEARRRKEKEEGGRGRKKEKRGRKEEVATLRVSVCGFANVCSVGFGYETIFNHVLRIKTKTSCRHEQCVTAKSCENQK